MAEKTYLDYNATAPLRPEAIAAMQHLLNMTHMAHNASAVHSCGREGRKIIDSARREIAALMGADASLLTFNSGATEGNNTVLQHFRKTYPDEAILISAIEHPSILEAVENINNVHTIPVHKNGLIDVDALENLLQEYKTCLVSIMAVNNETGSIQNVSELSKIIHRNGALFHCDAAQAAGRIEINMAKDGIDFLTLSAHKMGGMQGVGALAMGACGQSPALLFGGGQEKSLRAGTENVIGIAGFGAAAKAAKDNLADYQSNMKALQKRLENGLKEIAPDIEIHSADAPRAYNTCFFSTPNANSQSLLMALDLEGIMVSNGSACSSGTVKPSKTLRAMGASDESAAAALRVSFGWASTQEDIDAFLNAWSKIYARIKP